MLSPRTDKGPAMTDDTPREASWPFVRVWRSIARDQDFADLDPDAKVVYIRLLVEPDNNMAGLFTVTVNRWAKWANLSAERVWVALRVLDAARFVVLDEDEQELLVRTKLRNDTLRAGRPGRRRRARSPLLSRRSPRASARCWPTRWRSAGTCSGRAFSNTSTRWWQSCAVMQAWMQAWKQVSNIPTDHRPTDRRPADQQTCRCISCCVGQGVWGAENDERPRKQFTRPSKRGEP